MLKLAEASRAHLNPPRKGKKVQQKLNTEEVEALVAQAGSDPLAVAVHGINLTLAHHAAWTGEEFEKVNERFDASELREAAMGRRFDSLERRFDTVDVAFAKIDAHREEMARTLRFIELGQSNQGSRLDDIDRVQMKVLKRLDELETGQGELKAGQSRLEVGQVKLEAGQAKLVEGQGRLEERHEKLEAFIGQQFAQLGVRLDQVISFAVKGELKMDEAGE